MRGTGGGKAVLSAYHILRNHTGPAARVSLISLADYITATHWHRLQNPGKVALEIIEVQLGTYLGEDDFIRADDVYNRAPDETK